MTSHLTEQLAMTLRGRVRRAIPAVDRLPNKTANTTPVGNVGSSIFAEEPPSKINPRAIPDLSNRSTPIGGTVGVAGPNNIAGPGMYSYDPAVMSAYQKYMSYWNQADEDSASLRRKLADNMLMSQKNRAKSLLNSRIKLNEGGILNSGIALQREGDLNTLYDTTDRQMQNNLDESLTDISRRRLGYLQDYENSKVVAAQNAARIKAEEEAATIAAQRAAAAQTVEIQQLIAELGLTPTPTIQAPVSTPAATPIYKPPVAKKPIPKKPVVSAQPKLRRYGGPQ